MSTGRHRKPYRIKRKKPILKSQFLWFAIFIFIIISLFVYFLFFSDFFQIKNIIIGGNQKVSREKILSIIREEVARKNIFFPANNILIADLNEVENNILENFSQIAAVEINRELPETLRLTITDRKGVVNFCIDYELDKGEALSIYQECFLMDKNGIIFEKSLADNVQFPNLKSFDLGGRPVLGQKIMEADLLSKVLEICLGLENLKIPIKEILIVSNERINVTVPNGWDMYFNSKKDLIWQLTKLEAVLEKYIPLSKRKDLEYIELRFGNLAPFKYIEEEEKTIKLQD